MQTVGATCYASAMANNLLDYGDNLEVLRRHIKDESVDLVYLDPPFNSSATFYGRFRRYLEKAGLPASGLHILRHTAAKLRRDAGESVEDVSRFLDHSSLAVTTTYLRRLEGQEDRGWGRVAEAIGVVCH